MTNEKQNGFLIEDKLQIKWLLLLNTFLSKFLIGPKGLKYHQNVFYLKQQIKPKAMKKNIKENINSQKDPVFLKNKIYLKNNRIFSKEKLNNQINLNIEGEGNIIKINLFKGNGTLCITLKNTNFSNFYFGVNNQINNNLYINYYSACGIENNHTNITIGSHNTFNGNVSIVSPMKHGNNITIGDGNLFANNIIIKGNSDHKIYDIKNNKQINEEKGIVIQNHIWFCDDVLILNKTEIPSNNIIATRTILNKKYTEQYSLYAGQPATIKKNNINWSEQLN